MRKLLAVCLCWALFWAGVLVMEYTDRAVHATISTEITRISYSGNGSTTVFPYTFKVFANTDLQVIVRDSSGNETIQTLTTHYGVSGVEADAGGNVTMVTAPATGETLTILRNMPLKQLTDYTAGGRFPAESHEEALDKIVMRLQQLEERLDRSPHTKKTSTLTNIEIDNVTAGEYWRWNLAGTGIDTVAAVQDLGNFTQSGTGAVARTAISKIAEIVSIKDFGAVGDGAADDTTAIQNTYDAMTTGGMVFWPPGDYLSGQITVTYDRTITWGYGAVVKPKVDVTDQFVLNGRQFCGFAGLKLDVANGTHNSGFKLIGGCHRNWFQDIDIWERDKGFHIDNNNASDHHDFLHLERIKVSYTTEAKRANYGVYYENDAAEVLTNSIFKQLTCSADTAGVYIAGDVALCKFENIYKSTIATDPDTGGTLYINSDGKMVWANDFERIGGETAKNDTKCILISAGTTANKWVYNNTFRNIYLDCGAYTGTRALKTTGYFRENEVEKIEGRNYLKANDNIPVELDASSRDNWINLHPRGWNTEGEIIQNVIDGYINGVRNHVINFPYWESDNDEVTTQATSSTVIKTCTFPANSWATVVSPVGGRFFAAGSYAGANDKKYVILKFGAATLVTITAQAADQEDWSIEGELFVQKGDSNQARIIFTAHKGTSFLTHDIYTVTLTVADAHTLTLNGYVDNAGDSIVTRAFWVEKKFIRGE